MMNFPTMPSSMSSSSSTSSSSSSSSSSAPSPLSSPPASNNENNPNPFGHAVGKVLTLYPNVSHQYNYSKLGLNNSTPSSSKNQHVGTLFITTKAVCFQSCNWFGIETNREILPWGAGWTAVDEEEDKEEESTKVLTFSVGESTKSASHAFHFENSKVRNNVLRFAASSRKDWVSNVNVKKSSVEYSRNGEILDQIALQDEHKKMHREEGDMLLEQYLSFPFLEKLPDEDGSVPALALDSFSSSTSSSVETLSKESVEDREDDLSDATEGLENGEEHGERILSFWNDFRNAQDQPSFKEVVVKNMHLPCTVQQFHNLFLSDSSPHTYGQYLEQQGDQQVQPTRWQSSSATDSKSLEILKKTRSISYQHPINAPMAPPIAQATKTQQYHIFNPHGLVLDTQTVVDDVPMTDCFVVDDRILVERMEGGVHVSIMFEIRFVKSTMFRRIIEATTRSEFNKFLGGLIDLFEGGVKNMKEMGTEDECEEASNNQEDLLLENDSKADVAVTQSKGLIAEELLTRNETTVTSGTASPSPSPPFFNRYNMMFIFSLTFQFLMMIQMYRMRQSMTLTESRLDEILTRCS